MTNDHVSHQHGDQPPGHDVMPGDRDGVPKSEAALPRALMASGVPRIVILDENAVYDHYMRRLNRAWMRRIKVCAVVTMAMRMSPVVLVR